MVYYVIGSYKKIIKSVKLSLRPKDFLINDAKIYAPRAIETKLVYQCVILGGLLHVFSLDKSTISFTVRLQLIAELEV